MNLIEFYDLFSQIPGDYSIGVHGISSTDDNIVTAKKIIDTGLKFKGWGGILSNVYMFGQKKDMTDNNFDELVNYFFPVVDSNNMIVNIIVAIPESFKDSKGSEYYLGHFNRVSGYAKGNSEAGDYLPLNKYAEKIKYLPKEFIVGYSYGRYNTREFTFVRNPSFIGFMSEEDQTRYFESILNTLVEECYLVDKERLERFLSAFKKLGFHPDEYQKQALSFYEERAKKNNI